MIFANSKRGIEYRIGRIPPSLIKEYSDYWEKLTAKTNMQHFNAGLFALCSVNRSAAAGVAAYLAIKQLPVKSFSANDATLALVLSKAGLHDSGDDIAKFKDEFWDDPKKYYTEKVPDIAFRAQIVRQVKGLHLTKAAFMLELAYPLTCRAVCLDRHMLRAYGQEDSVSDRIYLELEDHWLKVCDSFEYPSKIVRDIVWNDIKAKKDIAKVKGNKEKKKAILLKYSNTRDWSEVLEEKEPVKWPDLKMVSQLKSRDLPLSLI